MNKKVVSICISVCMLFMACFIPVSALNTNEKIDIFLQEKLENMNSNDTIDVSVWLKDINYKEVAEEVSAELEQKAENGEIGKQAVFLPKDDLLTMKQAKNFTCISDSISPVNVLDMEQLSQEDAQTFIETKRMITSDKYEEQNTRIFNSLFPKIKRNLLVDEEQYQPEIIYSCKFAPNVMMTLTKNQIELIAQSPDVEEIYYYNDKADPSQLQGEMPAASVSDITAVTEDISLTYQEITGVSNMRIYNHADGKGVKIGQIELGHPDKTDVVFSHMIDHNNPENDKFKILVGENFSTSHHATCVAAIMVGKSSSFNAIVPNAELYTVSPYDEITYRFIWKQSMESLVEAGVNVINASCSNLKTNEAPGTYGDSSKWIDHLIYSHNVSVCMSSGNQKDMLQGTMAYNAITVGNINDNKTLDLSDDKRAYEYINGVLYQSAYSENATLAYKPDIMAPGATAGTSFNPMPGDIHNGGTSFAAPIVTGAAAQICSMYSYFKTKPALIKSALLAGAAKTQEMENYDNDSDPANNVDSISGSWRPAFDRMNGAGMVDVLTSAALLYDSCYLYFPNFGGTNNPLTQEIDVEKGSRLKICLSWLKKNTVSGSHDTNPVDDADKDTFIIELFDPQGELRYTSWYRNDTKEYIAFTPSQSGTYTIRVRKTNLLQTGTDICLCWYQR